MLRDLNRNIALFISVLSLLASPAYTLQKKASKDSAPPTVVLSIPAPTGNNGWYNEPVNVSIRAWDSGSGIKSAKVSLGGGAWYDRALTIRKDGTYLVIARASDKAGNTASASRIIHVDMTAPDVTFNVPESNGGLGWSLGPVDVSLLGSDELSGLYKTELVAEGRFESIERGLLDVQETYQPVGIQKNSEYVVMAETPSIAKAELTLTRSGKYLVSGYVEDMAGNRTPVEADVLLDVNDPLVSINAPDKYFGDVELSGSLLDQESSIRQVWVDAGNGWQEVDFDQTSWQTTWQTKDLTDDDYEIRVRAVDFAGNISGTSTVVTIVNNLWPVFALCGILLSLGLVAMYDPRKQAIKELTVTISKYAHMSKSASRIRKEWND
jgi:hypothetical protein